VRQNFAREDISKNDSAIRLRFLTISDDDGAQTQVSMNGDEDAEALTATKATEGHCHCWLGVFVEMIRDC